MTSSATSTTGSCKPSPAQWFRNRVVGLTFCLAILCAAIYSRSAWFTDAGHTNYEPQEGDVIFQSLPHGPVVMAIEGVTKSPYSHCGIVAKTASDDGRDGQWVVYEAIGDVHVTPLQDFLLRGRDGGFVAYRLRASDREHIPAVLKCCKAYFGRPYDFHYKFDDDRIYCSELIYKAFRDATHGQPLGRRVRFGDLNWQPFETLIRQIEGGEVPVDREMITPVDLARARQLEPVFSHRLPIETADGVGE